MAQDSMMYMAIAVGIGVVLLTDNPVKDALTTAVPSLKTSLASLQTSINNLIPKAAGAGDPSGTPADNPTAPAQTSQGKHKRGHGRNRHSNAAYQMDCGY